MSVGDFTSVDNVAKASVARLETNGIVDVNYDPIANNPGMAPFRWITTTTMQGDGKLLAGVFLLDAQCALYRFDQEGKLDPSFAVVHFSNDPNYSASIDSLTSQSDGRILVMGAFTSVDGTRITNFVRLESNGFLDVGFAPEVRQRWNL